MSLTQYLVLRKQDAAWHEVKTVEAGSESQAKRAVANELTTSSLIPVVLAAVPIRSWKVATYAPESRPVLKVTEGDTTGYASVTTEPLPDAEPDGA